MNPLSQLRVLSLLGLLQLSVQLLDAFLFPEQFVEHIHFLRKLHIIKIGRDSILLKDGVQLLLQCLIFLGQVLTLGPEFVDPEGRALLLILFLVEQPLEYGVLLLHLLECILVGDDQFVLLILKIVVLAVELVDLVLEIEAVGLVEQGVVVVVELVDLLALHEVSPGRVHLL